MRLLRTTDLADLFFDAKGTCQKRLRKLFDAGLIRAIVADLAAENRYALTPLGHAFLVEAQDDAPPWRPPPKVRGRDLVHLDLLNRYRIALAKGVAALGGALVRFAPDWELRSQAPQAELIPDAAVVIALPEVGRLELAVEIDAGTMPPTVVAKKLAKYDAHRMMRAPIFGLAAPRVLLVAVTPRRARSLARGLHGRTGSAASALVLLGAAPYVLADGGLATGLAAVPDLVAVVGALTSDDFGSGILRRATRQVATLATPATAQIASGSRSITSRFGGARS